MGEITVTECQMVNHFKGSKTQPPQFTRGYGLTFGHCKRKAMAMALVARALRAGELDEEPTAPAPAQAFDMPPSAKVETSGVVQHAKTPTYVHLQGGARMTR